MFCKHFSGIPVLIALLSIACCQNLQAQNVYPASGDALVHGVTIGTGKLGQTANTALGDSALFSNLKGGNLTAVGLGTLGKSTTGSESAAMGYHALYNGTTGGYNLAIGSGSLYNIQLGTRSGGNVALGQMTLYNPLIDTNIEYDVAVGAYTMYSNRSGYDNAAFGYHAMYNSSTAYYFNTAFGASSLATNTTGTENTAAGAGADVAYPNLTNATAIGYGAVATASNMTVVGNTSVTSIGGYVAWTTISDGRYKKNVARNVPGLAFINQLEPVTYTLDVEGIEARLHAGGRPLTDLVADPVMQQARQEKSRIVHTGFIAQDVEKAAESRGYHFSGIDKPKNDQQSFYGLRYSEFVAPLVKAAQELSAENDSLKATNDRLEARLDRIKQLLGIDSNARISAILAPGSARLFPNQPNPFSQTTLINYYVPQNSGNASLQITGMNGEIIKTIAVSGHGYGQVNLQTADLATGTYTYSLFVDGKLADTCKMVVGK